MSGYIYVIVVRIRGHLDGTVFVCGSPHFQKRVGEREKRYTRFREELIIGSEST